jgi:hypothetical protein
MTARWRDPALRAAFGLGFCILFAFIGTFTYVNFVLVRAPLSLGMMGVGFVYFVFLPSLVTAGLHFLVHPGDERGHFSINFHNRRIRKIDVLQVKIQQEPMMIRYAAVERLTQLLWEALIRGSARAASLTGSL